MTDQITITLVDSDKVPYNGRPVVALIAATVDGKSFEFEADKQAVRWYTDHAVVNSKGQTLVVTVR